jgi:hypothetical protein
VKKNIPLSKKKAMCDMLQSRAQAGKSTILKFQNREVDTKKLRRVMKEAARKHVPMHPGNAGIDESADITLNSTFPSGNRMYGTCTPRF